MDSPDTYARSKNGTSRRRRFTGSNVPDLSCRCNSCRKAARRALKTVIAALKENNSEIEVTNIRESLHLICLAAQLDLPTVDEAGRRILPIPVAGWTDEGMITPAVREELEELDLWQRCIAGRDALVAYLASEYGTQILERAAREGPSLPDC